MPRSKAVAKKSTEINSKKKLISQKVMRKTAPVSTGVKRKIRFRPGTVALRQIKRYQKSTENLIQRAPFQRKIRYILRSLSSLDTQNKGKVYRFSSSALLAIQQACQNAVVQLIEDAHLCTTHAKRQTLYPSDILLARRIRGDKY